MLKLLTFVTILVSVSPAAFADDAPCNFVIDSAGAGSKMGTVTCLYCVLMADYSNFGAANMVDNTDNYTSMVATRFLLLLKTIHTRRLRVSVTAPLVTIVVQRIVWL